MTDERPTARDALHTRSLPVAVRHFLHTEAAGGLALVAAAVVALIWANSPWDHGYQTLWHTDVTLKIGVFGIEETLQHLVNDGLMSLFFVVVALEIKRELVTGELRDPRVAALPAIAALGGMVLPAAIYLAVTAGTDATSGWGIPIATDIAFAVGVLALLGPRIPSPLKLFLLSLAIVDDIGAIVVIAVAYTSDLDLAALALAVLAVVVAVLCRRARIRWLPLYITLGVLCWLAAYNSGVHPTLAGVAFGLIAPARPLAPLEVARGWARDMSDEPTPDEMRQMVIIANETVSVVDRTQLMLHPVTSFVVVPVFALANAGVPISGDAFDASGATAVAAGVALGLLAGKAIGISLFSALAVRLGVARLPQGVTARHIVGVGLVAGIGFTVSLFITGLAFDDAGLQDAARLSVLATSVVAALAGGAVLLTARRADESPGGDGADGGEGADAVPSAHTG